MEQLKNPTDKLKAAQDLLQAAQEGQDVRNADPRDSSIEAVVAANKIMRARGSQVIKVVQSAL